MMYHMIACYGAMRHIGLFRADTSDLHRGDKCILRTDRGVELGEIVSRVDGSDPTQEQSLIGQVLRRATPRDLTRAEEIDESFAPQERKYCEAKIQEHNLPMKLVSVEHLFGGDKIIFYFLAEGRVDFRALVKDLAAQYRTRIEMRQIGVRDEARLLADVEHCGRALCCKSFMKDLAPVTMRMAKAQKTTLDPAKISGRCGRLMCCLRFEDASYAELRESLPRRGTRVKTPQGVGTVTGTEVLKQTVSVDLGGDRDVTFSLADIEPAAAEAAEGRSPEQTAKRPARDASPDAGGPPASSEPNPPQAPEAPPNSAKRE